MAYQEIIISPDILRLIDNSYRSIENDIDIRSYKNNLNLKKIILDKEKSLYSEYQNIINNATDLGKQQIDFILKSFLMNGRIEYKTLSNDFYSSNKINNTLFSLALKTNDKIINSNSGVILLEKLNNDSLKDIEILNIEEIIKPPSESNCFSLERTINITKGDKFEFDKIFKFYLSDTATIKISDKFIRKRKVALGNTIKILNCCNSLRHIYIYTNTFESIDDELSLSDLKKQIFNSIGIAPEIRHTGRHRRTIESDQFRIAIDPGLDFVDENNIPIKHDIEVNITPIQLNS